MSESDERIEKRMTEMRETAKKFAAAFAQKEHLDEFKKSKLAILIKKYEREGHKTSAGQEREARADAEYLQLLDALKTAIESSEALRWELKIFEIAVDVWRTKESSKRIERKGYSA